MAGNARFGIDLTADDLTGKGFDSASKRGQKFVDGFEKRRRQTSAKEAAEAKKAGVSFGKSFAAGERALGGGKISSEASRRLRDVTEAASTLKSAFAAAGAEGGGLIGSLGGVAAAGGVVVGVLAAAGLAAYKLADAWVKGNAMIGRTAATIGVSAKELQEFQGAAERFGVDKEAATGSLGGLASTLHEARYGRNNTALAAMNQLGLTQKFNADGTEDVESFVKDLSDAIKRQKSPQTQRRIADIFGVSSALPFLREGSGVLTSSMADVGKYGAVASDDDIARSKRMYGSGVALKQIGERGALAAGGLEAPAAEGVLNGLLAGGRGLVDGVQSGAKTAGETLTQATTAAGHAIERGATTFTRGVDHFGEIIENFAGVNRRTRGGRIHNPGNIRPVGGAGFRTFTNDAQGFDAMGRQIMRDVNVHGAHTLYDLLAGVQGKDGKRHWGYAPSGDHNDPEGYARQVAARSGIGMGTFGTLNAEQLAALMSAMSFRETGSKVGGDQLLPVAQKIVLEVRGLPAGTKVTASNGAHRVAVAHAMARDGP